MGFLNNPAGAAAATPNNQIVGSTYGRRGTTPNDTTDIDVSVSAAAFAVNDVILVRVAMIATSGTVAGVLKLVHANGTHTIRTNAGIGSTSMCLYESIVMQPTSSDNNLCKSATHGSESGSGIANDGTTTTLVANWIDDAFTIRWSHTSGADYGLLITVIRLQAGLT